MESSGNAGRGGSNHPPDRALLAGVLASEDGSVFYPDNYCLKCQREGVAEDERCFHRHWEIADQDDSRETR